MKQLKTIPRTVAIYTRKSSENDTKQSKSLSRQTNEVGLFCKTHNFVVVKEFSDTKSAWNKPAEQRDGFMKLIDWLDQDAGHLAVMTEVSRLSRRLDIWNLIRERRKQFRIIELGDNEPTELMLSIYLSVASEESKKIGERVRSAYQLKLKTHGKGNFDWGNPNIAEQSSKGNEAKSKKVYEHWEPILILDAYLYNAGLKQVARVEEINKQGHTSRPTKHNKNAGRPITASKLCQAHRIVGTGGVAELAKRLIK